MTYDEYMAMPDDGRLYELIEGELVDRPKVTPAHQRVALNILVALQSAPGEAFIGPLDIALSQDTVLDPDGMLITPERASIIGPLNIQGAPDIVIEVMLPETRERDEGVKRRLYERYGVNEYWLVDLESKSVKIYRRGFEIPMGETVTSPLLPEFSLPIREVFAE